MLPTPPATDYSPKTTRKLELTTVKSHISTHRRAWLTATVFLQLLIILSLYRASPPPPPSSTHRHHFEYSTTAGAAATLLHDETCKYGRVYVYDLPAMFNKDLLDNCHSLEPWASRCAAISNGGFGPPATNLGGTVPENLTPAGLLLDRHVRYSGEVLYHDRMMNHKCRTLNQNQATAFYLPFYVGLAVGKYLWFNYMSKYRDFHSVEMLNWVKNQDPFKKSNGSDHFIFLGRLTWDFRRLTDNDDEWGTKLLYMPLMKNVLRLGLENVMKVQIDTIGDHKLRADHKLLRKKGHFYKLCLFKWA